MWQSHIVREDFTLPYHAKPLHTQLHIALQQSPSLTNLHYTNAMNDSILYKTLLIFFFELTFSDLFFFSRCCALTQICKQSRRVGNETDTFMEWIIGFETDSRVVQSKVCVRAKLFLPPPPFPDSNHTTI